MNGDSLATVGGQPPAPQQQSSVGQSLADAFNVIAPALAGAAGATVGGSRGRAMGAEIGLGAGAEAVQAQQDRARKIQEQQAEIEYKQSLGAQAKAAADHMQAETRNLNVLMTQKAAFRSTLSEQDRQLFDTDPKAFSKKFLADQQQPYNVALAAKTTGIPVEYLAKLDSREAARIAEIGVRESVRGSRPKADKVSDKDGNEYFAVFDPSDPNAGVIKVPIPGAVKTADKPVAPPSDHAIIELERDWRLANGKLVGKLSAEDEQSLHDYQATRLKEMQALKSEVTPERKAPEMKNEKPAVNVDSSRIAAARKLGYPDAEIARRLGVSVEDLPK